LPDDARPRTLAASRALRACPSKHPSIMRSGWGFGHLAECASPPDLILPLGGRMAGGGAGGAWQAGRSHEPPHSSRWAV
jgi:hypothetical protein